LGRVVDDETEVAERLGILAVGDEKGVARVAQCLGDLRHRDVAVAIFFLGLFGEVGGGVIVRLGSGERGADLGPLEISKRRTRAERRVFGGDLSDQNESRALKFRKCCPCRPTVF
jgi:hypothetical protein